VFHNQRFLDLMGLPASLMEGKPSLNVLVDHQYRMGVFPPGMSREDVSRVYGHVDGQWLISPGQYLREGPDGQVFEIKTSGLPSGGWVRTYADVTDYVEAQRALKRGEERLQLMLQGSNDGAWDWNLETGECYFSPRWWTMLGMRSNEREAHNDLWNEFIHPHDALRVTTEIAQALAEDRRSFELEFRMLHRDGSVLTVLDRGFIVRDENQRAIRVSGTLTDISARKRLEQRLEQSEASLSAFFEAIPDCVWFKDTEGRYVLCNPGKARLYGTTVERMLGKTEFDLVPVDQAWAYHETDLRALQSGQHLVYEEGGLVEGEHRIFEVVKCTTTAARPWGCWAWRATSPSASAPRPRSSAWPSTTR
jgi:PAS domain S-box-containing protein